MHDCLEGIDRWQTHVATREELERRITRWAQHDLQVRRQRTERDQAYAAAVDAAVEAGQPAPPPPPPVATMSRSGELLQQRVQLVDLARQLMTDLRPEVAARARARETELLTLVLETPVARLRPIVEELEEIAATLRQVLLDGNQYRATIDVGEVVEAALEPGSSVLYLLEQGPSIHVDRQQLPPAGRVMVDRDPSPRYTDALAERRQAEARRISRETTVHVLG